jgi:hypothetical protein
MRRSPRRGATISSDSPDEEPADDKVSQLTEEQQGRYEFFSQSCRFRTQQILDMMIRGIGPGTSHIQNPAVRTVARAAELFAAELIETARAMSSGTGPLTPDLIFLAFDSLARRGKIPGLG